jgi:hypothetical protein
MQPLADLTASQEDVIRVDGIFVQISKMVSHRLVVDLE